VIVPGRTPHAVHSKNTADWQDQPTDEIMVWLNGKGRLDTKSYSVDIG
jgi:hypothetical protein